MADIKFYCPECQQRIAVDESAAGMAVDCPDCTSSLLIPKVSEDPAQVLVRRRPAGGAGSGSAYEELEAKHRELAAALEDGAQLRVELERVKTALNNSKTDAAKALRGRPAPAETQHQRDQEQHLKDELAQMRTQFDAAKKERDDLTQRLAAHETESQNVLAGQTALSRARAEIEETRRSLDLEIERSKAADAIAAQSASQEIEALRAQVQELGGLKRAHDDAETALKESKQQAEKALADVGQREGEISQVRSQLEEARAEIAATRAKLDEHGATAGKTIQQKDEAVKRLEALALAHDELRRQLHAHEEALHVRTHGEEKAKSEVTRLKQKAAETAKEHEKALEAAALVVEGAKNETAGSAQEPGTREELQRARDTALAEFAISKARADQLNAELERRAGELQSVREQMDEAKKEIAAAKARDEEHAGVASELEREKKEAQDRADALARERDEARHQVSAHETALQAASAAGEDAKAAFSRLDLQHSATVNEHQSLKQIHDESVSALQEVQKRADELQTNLQRRDEELAQAREQHESARGEIAAAHAKLEEQASAASQTAHGRKEVQDRFDALTREHEEARHRISSHEEALRAAAIAADAARNEISRLEQERAEAAQQHESLRRAHEESSAGFQESKRQMETLRADLTRRDGELSQLREQLEGAKREISTTRARLEEAVHQSERRKKEAQDRLEALAREHEEARHRISTHEEALQAASMAAELAKGEISRLDLRAAEAEKEHESLKRAHGESLTVLQEARNQAETLQSAVKRRDDDFGKLLEQFDGAKGELSAARSKNEELTRAAAQLDRERKEAQDRLEVLTREHEEGRRRLAAQDESLRNALLTGDAAKGDKARLTAQNGELAKERDTLKRAHEQASTSLQQFQKRAEALEPEYAEARRQLEAAAANNAALQAKLGAQVEATSKAGQIATELQKRFEGLAREHEEARRRISKHDEVLRAASAAAETAKGETDALRAKAVEIAKAYDALKKVHEAGTAEIKETRQREEKHAADLKTREAELVEIRGWFESAKGEYIALRTKLTEKEGAVKTLERRLVELHEKATKRVMALENETASLRADLQRAQREGGELRRQTEAAEKALRAKVDKAVKSDPATQEKIRAMEIERDGYAAESKKAKSELVAMSEELRKARVEHDAAKSVPVLPQAADNKHDPERLRAIEAERDALRQELEGVKEGLDRAKQHVTQMQTRRDQMRDEIARLKASLGHAPDAMT